MAPQLLADLAAAARLAKDCVPGWAPHAPAPVNDQDPRADCAKLLFNGASLVAAPLAPYGAEQLLALSYGMDGNLHTPQQQANLAARRRRSREMGLRPIPAAPAAVAAVASLQRWLAALRDSGVLSDLCAGVLAAPPCPSPVANPRIFGLSQQFAGAQWNLVRAIACVGMMGQWHCGPWAVDILASLPVMQLRMEGLEQVVASQQEEQQQQQGLWQLLMNVEAPAGGNPAGGSRNGSGSDAESRVWPLLQLETARSILPKYELSGLASVYIQVLEAAVSELHPTMQEVAFPHTITGPAAAWSPAAAAQRIYPPRPQAVALLSRACAALCSHLERLSAPPAALLERITPSDVVGALSVAGRCCAALAMLLRGAPPAEAAAHAPDVLVAHARLLRATVACAGLAPEQPIYVGMAVSALEGALAGIGEGDGERPAEADSSSSFCEGWQSLGADVQGACARALLPTRLMASLDAGLRQLAQSGPNPSSHMCTAVEGCASFVPCLLPALLRARLLPAAASGAAAGTADGAARDCQWQPLDELGVLVTAAKLARREAARMAAAVQITGEAPDEWAHIYPANLINVLSSTTLHSMGLPQLLLELDDAARAQAAEAVGSGSGGSSEAGGSPPPLARARRAVVDAIVLCGCSSLELQTARVPFLGAGAFDSPDDTVDSTGALLHALQHALSVVVFLPPAVLLACADPRRLMAAVARVLLTFEQRGASALGEEAARYVDQTRSVFVKLVLFLSADEELLEACAPGLLWVSAPRAGAAASALPADKDASYVGFWQNLAGFPDAPPRGPVIAMDCAAAAAALGGRPWAEHAQCLREVAALARSQSCDCCTAATSVPARVRAAIAADIAAEHVPAWPPRLLKLCANPGCNSFMGAREADLALKRCSGCRALSYCSPACLKAHWPQHKAECKRLAAAGGGGEAAAPEGPDGGDNN